MNSILNKTFIFSVGVAVGSVVTWKILEAKYEQLIQEEIKAFKAEYSNAKKNDEIEDDDAEIDLEENTDRIEYASILENEGYTGEFMKKGDAVGMERPYTIEPDECGNLPNYEVIELTYYADGILADDMDNIIDDVDFIVGDDFADYFGEYEDDAVFIRNDARKCDYEICRDVRRYYDVAGDNPHLTDYE